MAVITILMLSVLPAAASKKASPKVTILEKASHVAAAELRDNRTAEKFRNMAAADAPDSVVYDAVYLFGKSLFYMGRQMVAFDLMRQIVAELESVRSSDTPLQNFRCNCYLLLGAASDETGMRNLSMDFYMKGLQIAEGAGNMKAIGAFYNNIGVSYYRVLDKKQAEKYFMKALETNKKCGSKADMFLNYNNLSEIECDRGDFRQALSYALSAIECIDEKKQADDFYSMQSQIGNIYRKMDNREMALVYLDNAFRNQQQGHAELHLAETCLQLADYYTQYYQPDSVAKYVALGKKLAVASGHPSLIAEVLKRESDMAERAGDYRLAASLQKRIRQIADSIGIVENKSNVEQVQHIYETEKNIAENAFPIARWNPVVVFVSMGLMMLALIVVFVIFLATKRKKDLAVAAEIRVGKALEALRESQLAEEIRKKDLIQKELDSKHRNLTAVSLEKLKTSQLLADIDSRLKDLLRAVSPRDKEQQDNIKQILRLLAQINYNTDWDEFHYYFEKVQPEFYQRIVAAHPSLTQKDQRLCALIWLGLNTKDIAALTFREVRSVESSRNRLRKKMNLATNDNLYDYIRQFSSGDFADAGPDTGGDAAASGESDDAGVCQDSMAAEVVDR